MARAPIDFTGLAAALLDRVSSLLPLWLPQGVERNERWYVGDFDGSAGESANVNMRTGQWIDNAAPDEECGGDLISLYGRIHGLGNGQAARQLMHELGWERAQASAHAAPSGSSMHSGPEAPLDDTGPEGPEPPPADDGPAPPPAGPGAAGKRDKATRWRCVMPVPRHAPRPEKFTFGFKNSKTGQWESLESVRHWAYEFEGELFGYVARFERVNSDGELVKDTVPFTWCEDTWDPRGLQRWHSKQWPAPRPLYVPAALLSGDPSTIPVVLVEGEKCAEAGHQLLGHEFDFVSWPGGGKAWAMARWGTLLGRTVYLWPDCDAQRERPTKAERERVDFDPKSKPLRPERKQPGMQTMVHIGSLLLADQGCSVFMCQIPKPGAVGDGWDIADAIAEGWDAAQVRAFIRGAAVFVPPEPEAVAKAGGISTPSNAGAGSGEGGSGGGGAGGDDGEDPSTAWRKHLIPARGGGYAAVRENVVLALDGLPERGLPGAPAAMGVIAFNDFTNDVIKLHDTPWGTPAGVWDEVDELELGNWLVREHWLPSMSRGTLEEAVSMVAKRHRYHPVRDELDALRGTWDGEKRLATWLRRCCLEEDEFDDKDPLQQYLARVGTWLVMAIAARVSPETRGPGGELYCGPGCKFDYMVIFEGPQGVGKSTLARILGGEHFADTGLVLGDKDSYQNLQGILVYEWGELDSLTKAEVTKVKQFISSQKDRFRASFDRRAKDYPRQVVFVGTTNEDHYLVDQTGNRRMWPVRVTRPVDLEWLRANRAQMFAEALHYLDERARFHPTTREQRELFDPQQARRQIESAIQAAVLRYLYDERQEVGVGRENGALVEAITAPELLGRLGISLDKQTHVLLRQVTAALRQAGWERFRAPAPPGAPDASRPWKFRRPSASQHRASGASASPQPSSGGPTQGHQTSEVSHDEACPF